MTEVYCGLMTTNHCDFCAAPATRDAYSYRVCDLDQCADQARAESEYACPVCGGSGFLANQEYGFAAIPDGWIPVQRCDACGRYAGDDDAAAALAEELGTEYAYWSPEIDSITEETGTQPGDWAVRGV